MPFHPEPRPIFLVDDDPDVALLVQHLLRKSGVPNPLQAWADPAEALAEWTGVEAAAARGGALPLFVLVDLKMPNLGGLEVLSWLRDHPRLATRPRIVISSSMDKRDVNVAYAAGANGFLTKYPDALFLAALVRQAENGTAAPGSQFAPPQVEQLV